MRIRFILLSIIIGIPVIHSSFAQETEEASRFTFLPGILLSPPLTASYQEPRIGLRKEFGSSRLKVDIGGTIDVLEFRPAGDSLHRIRLGIDFFTYALSTNSEGLRLQIDAVDGFFGGHVTYVNRLEPAGHFTLRLRLLHLSAHFLDGHFSNSTQTWKDNRTPIPFTRDFGELLGIYELGSSVFGTTFYAGFSYATLIRPTTIRRTEYHGGFELYTSTAVRSVFGKPFNFFVANHFTLRGIPSYIGTNNFLCGVKLGDWKSTGLKLYFNYYNGLDVFSQYYDVRREDAGIGVSFDFW